MANFVFNIAKGSVNEKIADGANLICVLLKTAEADATLKDHDTLAALLAGSSTEADFTNYSRKTVLNANTSVTVNDSGDTRSADITVDLDYDPAGGASNNSLVKLIVCEDGASDAARIPLTAHDLSVTTDGSRLVISFDASGFFTAS